MKNTILVTGGAGFIGSALIRHLIESTDNLVINFDKLTYAANLKSLDSVTKNENYSFMHADICDRESVEAAFLKFRPDYVMHLAAESHVDRSISGPTEFIQTNIVGTSILLEQSTKYFQSLQAEEKKRFRFLHVSTDEVYGELGKTGFFSESTSYNPSSPYSASKASSDHLVRAWHKTYGLPSLITNCSNNYGPYQHCEKLIPLMISSALQGKSLPVYGKGEQIRDWFYVDDHVRALYKVLTRGKIGETYNVGGNSELKNIDLVTMLCEILNELVIDKPQGIKDFKSLISFVDDRPGHDFRYAIDASKVEREIGWKPEETFESGIRKTVQWYLDNLRWFHSYAITTERT